MYAPARAQFRSERPSDLVTEVSTVTVIWIFLGTVLEQELSSAPAASRGGLTRF